VNVFFDLIAALMAFVYDVWNNYAWAITGLTLLVMVAVTPLTLKGTRSMMMMQQLMPEQKKLQNRYKDDRQKYNEELLKFYKENNISPLGGCLPLMVQMPIFIVLYAVLRGLTRRTSPLGFNLGFTGGQLGKGVHLTIPPTPIVPASGPHCATPTATPGACFDPSYLHHSTSLYQNLSHTNVMQAMGMNLAESASTAVKGGVIHSLPYILLIVVVGVTGWVQQKQIQGRTPADSVPQQQQALMKIMPFFLPVISIGLPAGLVLYFAVSNLYRVGQQWFISRSIYGPATDGASSGKAKPSGSPSGSATKTLPAAKKTGAKAIEATAVEEAKPKPTVKGRRPTAAPATEATTNGRASTGSGRATPSPKATKAAKADPKTATTAKGNGAKSTAKDADAKDSGPPAKPIMQPRARKNRKG
jgi:YidC/Oxa1 family membrane protein insertase